MWCVQLAGPAAIVKAADTGKTAWKPGSSLSDTQKARAILQLRASLQWCSAES